jgi:hypothetical protein
MAGILYKILTILISLCGNTSKHIREILYFVYNIVVFQMAHFYWCIMSSLASVNNIKLDELHRLSRHAISKKVIFFHIHIFQSHRYVMFASIVDKNLAHIVGPLQISGKREA